MKEYNSKYEREIKRILENKWGDDKPNVKYSKLSPAQLKTLERFAQYYSNKPSPKGGKIKPASVSSILHTMRKNGSYVKGKPFEKVTKQDNIDFITKGCQGQAIASISGLKMGIITFYKWLYGIKDKHKLPEVVDDELLQPERAPPRKISHGDLLIKDEILKMIENCLSPQDKCIVSIWFEMGLRGGEFCSLNVDSVEFVSGGAKLYIEESKTEEGFIPLIQSAPYLEDWLKVHPLKDDPKAPLFITRANYTGRLARNRFQPNGINQKLKLIAKRAGIKKRIFTHLGRNMSITRLDGEFTTEDNARLHGITPNTIMRVYTRRTRKQACDKYFSKNGAEKTDEEKIKEKQEKDKLMPKKCENCGTINPYDKNYCSKCLRPIDVKTFLQLEKKREIKEKITEMAMDKGQPINKETIKDILKEIIQEGGFNFF